jgi:hypothetical protein
MIRRESSIAGPPARRSWLGVVFVVVVAQLFAWNLYVIGRNQRILGKDETPRRRPGNIVTLAMKNPADVVRFFLATFYYLRVLAGKTLVIPFRYSEYRLFFERVSRLHVEIQRPPPRLAPLSALRLQELVERRYFLGVGTSVDVVLSPAAERYVMAEAGEHAFLVLPEPLYQRELAANPPPPVTPRAKTTTEAPVAAPTEAPAAAPAEAAP